MRYRIAVDIGGTFTDCVLLDSEGRILLEKTPTTPRDLATGVMLALQLMAARLGKTVEDMLANTAIFIHGSTVATNTIIERNGARCGLITTRGHEDTIPIGRIYQKKAGLSEREIIHVSQLKKPDPPIITREYIKGVAERLDYRGEIVVPLNLAEAKSAIEALIDQGAEAVGICLLWSFLNPIHENSIRSLIEEKFPHIYVSASYELVPKLGEYERSVTVLLNCYIGPKVRGYLDRLEDEFNERRYFRPLLTIQASGGLTWADEAKRKPILTLDSGPVGGTLGCQFFANLYGEENIICTDVGGTSFDVSLIYNREIQLDNEPTISQYTYLTPKVLIKSIGAGGGSIAWVDAAGILKVGPRSAGSIPGPVCYDQGGTQPTVTDANLVLGYINPDFFLGGRLRLNRNKAERAIKTLADKLGMTTTEAASGIFKILNAQMADLIRKATIEKGYDPRDFVLFAYGGAGPTHAAFYSRDVGVRATYILSSSTAFSALGMLTSDIVHRHETSHLMRTPLSVGDIRKINDIFQQLKAQLYRQYEAEGVQREEVQIRKSIFLRYQLQVHQLELEIVDRDLTEADIGIIEDLFERKYTSIYGPDTAYREAGLELITYKVEGSYKAFPLHIARSDAKAGPDPRSAFKGSRRAFFEEYEDYIAVPVYDGYRLEYGHVLAGPCIVERMGDTAVLPPETVGSVDAYGNIVINWEK